MPKRTKNDLLFDAIRIEGGILPAEFLNAIAGLEAPDQTEAEYGIPKGLKLRDEIGRYWRIAHGLWQTYIERVQREDLDADKIAVDEWLAPLFKQVLGFTDLRKNGLTQIGERSFPVNHFACDDQLPLVLTTATHALDKGAPVFGDEGRKRSPHALAQEFLNAEERCLWAIVSNGVSLRLVRDNPSLTRPAYVEVDLERLFGEELYPDFAAVWLIFHATRFATEDGDPHRCIIESWREQAHETGERALKRLRDGVTRALRALGSGFLQHSANQNLRAAIESGDLTEEGYFQQLLRLVYRLLFLFTTEDRNVLHAPDTSSEARELYREAYSIASLRERAQTRRHYDRHGDLWEGLVVTFRSLVSGAQALSLPPLGGLFAADQCSRLDEAAISNQNLLTAVHALAFFPRGETLARINYRDMDTEELGSVYESLLERLPIIRVNSQPWTFGFQGDDVVQEGPITGSARKLTGSYYTPGSLVQEIIQSALEPVIERCLQEHPANPKPTLLGLKIVDPAAGSGHFLLAAARRLAVELARIEAGVDQPTEAGYRHALREVVAHCIYGVDVNPLAVELCKTALWLETVEPGKPLGFLDAHIRCGNSLLGILDPVIMKHGIPDAAYKALTGDDRKTANQLKRRNREVGGGIQGELFGGASIAEPEACTAALDAMSEDTPAQIAAKKTEWERVRASYACRQQRLLADFFTAAFFAAKTPAAIATIPTTEDLRRLREGMTQREGVAEMAREVARHHRFFHWYIEFAEVFANGGFDVVLGNPPWERIKIQEKEFFAAPAPNIARAKNAAARRRMIDELNDPPPETPEGIRQSMRRLYQEFQQAKQAAEAASQFAREGGRFPLTGKGDVSMPYSPRAF